MQYAQPQGALKEQLDQLLDDTDAHGDRRPWLQMDGEPDDAYEAFFFFRSLPATHRSTYRAYHQFLIVRAPQVLEQHRRPCDVQPPAKWNVWLEEYSWERRANAWDDATRRVLFTNETEDLQGMVKRHHEALLELQRMGMEYINASGFESAATALRAVHHSQDKERQLAGLPDISHVLIMDDRALVARYENLLQQLPSAVKDKIEEKGFAHVDIDGDSEEDDED